jgi:hypothetical protein
MPELDIYMKARQAWIEQTCALIRHDTDRCRRNLAQAFDTAFERGYACGLVGDEAGHYHGPEA